MYSDFNFVQSNRVNKKIDVWPLTSNKMADHIVSQQTIQLISYYYYQIK